MNVVVGSTGSSTVSGALEFSSPASMGMVTFEVGVNSVKDDVEFLLGETVVTGPSVEVVFACPNARHVVDMTKSTPYIIIYNWLYIIAFACLT